jgi:hypothetical protein
LKESAEIQNCLDLIEKKVQWGSRQEWTAYNFDQLSRFIKEASGITLSARTLRRLIHTSQNYKPQTATKNALALFLGYNSWEELRKNLCQNEETGNFSKTGQQQKRNTIRNIFKNLWFYIALFIVVLFIIGISFYPRIILEINKSKVKFTSNYIPGPAPQRVTFFYDVSRINTSNIFINKNFYDDGEIIAINKNRHFFTSDFDLPDHYSVKIIANGERISCIRIHVLTNGWEAVLNGKHLGVINQDVQPGLLLLPTQKIHSNMDSSQTDYHLEYRNLMEFGADGDAITLETEIRLVNDGYVSDCMESTVQLINLHGRVGFTFIKPGCDPSLLEAEFGDVLLNGQFNDLGAFYQNMDCWHKVTIKTEKKHIYVSLNDSLIYEVKYKDPLHDVKGIAYKFHGFGQVNYVRLFNSSGNLVYEDNF